MTVEYSCPGAGITAAKVVVHNRQDCCQSRLDYYSLFFLDGDGVVDAARTFKFSGSQLLYTILAPGECRCAAGAAALVGAGSWRRLAECLAQCTLACWLPALRRAALEYNALHPLRAASG